GNLADGDAAVINNSSLLGLFGTPGAATGGFGGGVRSPSRQRQPTPPPVTPLPSRRTARWL
ncbi:MAG: hypothetical protein ACK58O_08245, partial [Brevundimonas sp.]